MPIGLLKLYTCAYIYIYICIERERDVHTVSAKADSPPQKEGYVPYGELAIV